MYELVCFQVKLLGQEKKGDKNHPQETQGEGAIFIVLQKASTFAWVLLWLRILRLARVRTRLPWCEGTLTLSQGDYPYEPTHNVYKG
jgi:hypothetical protein